VAKYTLKHRPKLTILEGAVRSGKTFVDNFIFMTELGSRYGRGIHGILTGHTLGSVERNVVEPLSNMLDSTIKLDNKGKFRLFGNTVHCFGADNADSYKAVTGMTAHLWYANEVTLQHPNTIAECFARVSGDDAVALWDTNPDYPGHPVKVDYIDHSGDLLKSGRLRIKAWHFELEDNTFLEPEYVENLKATMPKGMWYDRKIKGLWVAAEGAVYENWNRDIHVVDPFAIPDSWERIRGVDFGFQNPFVCLWGALDEDGRLYIIDEHYKSQTLIAGHADAIKRRKAPAKWTTADHDAQGRAELNNLGIWTRAAQKEVELGIQKVAERLVVQKHGKPRLMVFRTCENTIREMEAYRWQPNIDGKPQKEEPLKVDDHCPDTVRYMVMELDNPRVPEVIATRRVW